MNNVIELRELRRLINETLDELLYKEGEEIVIAESLYWSVPKQDLFNMEKVPCELDVGNVLDEVKFLRSAMQESRLIPSTHLEYIAGILRWLAQL